MSHTYPESSYFKSLEDIRGAHITVMGLGLHGGGLAAARFLLAHGALVTVTDLKTEEELRPSIEALRGDAAFDASRLRLVLGRHDLTDFSSADVVIKNPGVRYEGNPFLAAARVIETDLSLFLSISKAPLIAVTGSKGKSSTASAIHYGLTEAGFKAFLGGNITLSPLSFLEETSGITPVVLELSSWQLADLRGRELLKPRIALITPIMSDHQNWYGDMASYVADKKLIYACQDESCWTVCEDPDNKSEGAVWSTEFAEETGGKLLYYRSSPPRGGFYGAWLDGGGRGRIRLPPPRPDSAYSARVGNGESHEALSALGVPGHHMRVNALNASLVLALMGVKPAQAADILARWKGIPHRLELCLCWKPSGSASQVLFYNDSAATLPEAACAALDAFARPVHFICGGTDKNLDFAQLVQTIAKRSPLSLSLIAGSATDKLIPLLERARISWRGPFDSLEGLTEDLKPLLLSHAQRDKEQIVLFSPGAASFGLFKNEFDRGNTFKSVVEAVYAH